MIRKITLLLLCLNVALVAKAQKTISYFEDPANHEREHPVDITKMKVDVSFEPEKGLVKGKVTHSFVTLQKNIDTLFFDAPGITVTSLKLDGAPIMFLVVPQGVIAKLPRSLNWDEKHEMEFIYTATPRKGIYFVGWNRPENTGIPDVTRIRKQIWTQGQGIDHRHWIPMYDNMNDKFVTETTITFDSKYKVLSNGKLIAQKDNKNGTHTWNYAMEKPHAGYLLMLAIGNYEVKTTKTKRGTVVNFWYYPEFKDRVEPTSVHTEKMIEFLEDETGIPYPWGAYSQVMVQEFLYGAMENTSATIFGDFFFVDKRGFNDRNYIGVNAHELTHQWFGDLITARAGHDVWLQESFATYYAKIFFELIDGTEAVKWAFRSECNSALSAAEKNPYPVRHTGGGTARVYSKGSAVLSMLRYVIGDEEFKRFIKHYLEIHGFKNVEAEDFQKAIKDKLGMNLDWFFDQWIQRSGEPHYKISVQKMEGGFEYTIEQIHEQTDVIREFKMPVNFALYLKNGTVVRKKVWIEKNFQKVFIKANGELDFALFDENSEILKKVTFDKTTEQLLAQLAKAEKMIDRYDALLALSSVSFDKKKDALLIAWQKETFHAMRSEIVKQLAAAKYDAGWFLAAVDDKTVQVRLALAQNLPADATYTPVLVKLLTDSSYNVVENALDKLMVSNNSIELKGTWLNLVKDVQGINNAIRIKWCEYTYMLSANTDKASLGQLVALSGPDFEFRTRVGAFQALKRLNTLNAEITKNLLDAIASPNSRLAGPASEVLTHFKNQPAYLPIINNAIQSEPFDIRNLLKIYGW